MIASNPNPDEAAREHRQRVIETMTKRLKSESVSEPIRLEFDRLPNDVTFEGIVQPKGCRNIWLVAPLPNDKRTANVKVERDERGRWSCG